MLWVGVVARIFMGPQKALFSRKQVRGREASYRSLSTKERERVCLSFVPSEQNLGVIGCTSALEKNMREIYHYNSFINLEIFLNLFEINTRNFVE